MPQALKRLLKRSRWLLLLLSLAYLHWLPRDYVDRVVYDLFHPNPYIATQKQLDEILQELPKVKGSQLPPYYLKETYLNEPSFRSIKRNTSYYILSKKDVYRRIIGQVRVRDLMPRDEYYQSTFLFSRDTLYWGIDKRILHRLLDLQDLLAEKGYDRDAFWVRHGHRHPRYNEEVGGARKSRHLYGDAIDLVIKDINQDGKYTKDDKDIVLDLCEKYIIKNQGGIGRYPWSRTVHIDLRGRRARWDSY